MNTIPHPDLICGLASSARSPVLTEPHGSPAETWSAVRSAADGIDQGERFERLRRLRALIIDAHQVRETGHVYDLGDQLNELEFGHNFRADSRFVSELPMEVAYIHFGYTEHMLFGDDRWIDGVYIRDVSDAKAEGMLFTFVSNDTTRYSRRGKLTAKQLCEASNCASAFVSSDMDPRYILHDRSNYRGDPMLSKTIKIINGAEIALYGLSMLSPLRPLAKSWTP